MCKKERSQERMLAKKIKKAEVNAGGPAERDWTSQKGRPLCLEAHPRWTDMRRWNSQSQSRTCKTSNRARETDRQSGSTSQGSQDFLNVPLNELMFRAKQGSTFIDCQWTHRLLFVWTKSNNKSLWCVARCGWEKSVLRALKLFGRKLLLLGICSVRSHKSQGASMVEWFENRMFTWETGVCIL